MTLIFERKPKHCWHCKYFTETVFECETEHGMGSWYGYCENHTISGQYEVKGRYIACGYGGLSEEQVKKDEPFKCMNCGVIIPRIKRLTKGKIGVCSMECANEIDKEDAKA